MPRLGERLVALGVVEADKIEHALRAQVVWGGRLGTNLIELGYIDLDELSRALGKHHNLPAALARHFERADPALQQQLPAEVADRHSFVPILRLADNKIAGAAMDPLGPEALAEIAHALSSDVDDLVTSVAAEQRMRYQLERVYGIARATRYLRSRGPRFPSFPAFGDMSDAVADPEFELPSDGSPDDMAIPIELEEQRTIVTQRASTDELEAMIDEAVSTAPPPPSEPAGAERRHYVPTLADVDPLPPRPSPEPQTLGRIAIRKIMVATGAANPGSAAPVAPAPPDVSIPATTLAEAARAIRRGHHREQVADLVIDAIDRFAMNCHSAVLLIVRGDTATSWRSFCRDSETPSELAVPLDEPGVVQTAIQHVQTCRAQPDQQSTIDQKLLAALDCRDSELAAIPVAVAGTALGVLAVAIEPDAAIPNVDTIATAAGTALARLMRDAAR